MYVIWPSLIWMPIYFISITVVHVLVFRVQNTGGSVCVCVCVGGGGLVGFCMKSCVFVCVCTSFPAHLSMLYTLFPQGQDHYGSRASKCRHPREEQTAGGLPRRRACNCSAVHVWVTARLQSHHHAKGRGTGNGQSVYGVVCAEGMVVYET